MSEAECEVLVVGAGPAGLACATRLRAAGREVLLLEAQACAGGNAQSRLRKGFLLEHGPHTFLPSADAVLAATTEAGLLGEVIESRPAARRRYIVRERRLHKVFSGPISFLTSRLLSGRGKWQLLGEVFRTQKRGHPEDSAEVFFTRRFGAEAARVLAGAFIGGIYAGNPARLSAPAAFPLFWRFEQEHGSLVRGAFHYLRARRRARRAVGQRRRWRGLCSFRAGLGQLTAGLAATLGERLWLSAEVRALAPEHGGWLAEGEFGRVCARRLVLAVPPSRAATLIGRWQPQVAEALTSIRLAPLAVLYLGFRQKQDRVPDGFGFLAPPNEGVNVLGVLFPSRLFPGRAPEGGDLFTAYLGGERNPEALGLDDASLLQTVLDDFRTLGCDLGTPDLVEVRRIGEAIPQLELGHLERLRSLAAGLEKMPGIYLAGNYLRGVGLKDALASGQDAARAILEGEGVRS